MHLRLPAYPILLAIVILAVPGCDFSEDSSVAEQERTDPVILRRGNGGDPQTLDPAFAEDDHAFRVLTDIYEGLLTIDSKGDVIPGVAQEWSTSPDGLTYTFQLRPDAVWSNGAPILASHFVSGLRRPLLPDAGSAYSFLLYPIRNAQQIQDGELAPAELGVYAPDPHTVVIELEAPAAHFPAVLAMPIASPAFADTHGQSQQFRDPQQFVGNGPYVLDEWHPGHLIRLRKNTRFHKSESVQIDVVEYYAISDLLTELNMYRAGELDITASVPGPNIDDLMTNRAAELRISPKLGIYYLAFDLSEPPLDDPDIRRALTMAIDRNSLVRIIGRGEQPAYGFIPDGIPGYAPSRYDWQHLTNGERESEARLALASSPHSSAAPITLKLTFDAGDVHERIAVAVSSMWQSVLGIEVELDKREWKYFLSTRDRREEWQVMRFAWTGDYNHPSTFTDILTSTSPQNLPGYRNKKYDDTVSAALVENDPSKQARLMADAEATLLADYPVAPLYFYISKHLVSPAVRGFDPNAIDRHPSRFLWLSEKHLSKSNN